MDQQSRSLAASPHIASMNRMRTDSEATGRAIPLYSATQRRKCCERGRTLGSARYHPQPSGVHRALLSGKWAGDYAKKKTHAVRGLTRAGLWRAESRRTARGAH